MTEPIDILELEIRALRIQNEKQLEIIASKDRELRFLRRFKNLVDRAGEIVDNLVVNIPTS